MVFLSSSLTGFLYFKFRFVFWWRCLGIFAMCILLLLRTTWIILILFAKSTVLIICGITVKLCANGHNNSQQCWDLQCIVGRIHLIRLSNIVAIRFGNHGTNEMLGVVGSKIWPVSNFVQQLPITCNRVCKPMEHVVSNNFGSCSPTMLHLFARCFKMLNIRLPSFEGNTYFLIFLNLVTIACSQSPWIYRVPQ